MTANVFSFAMIRRMQIVALARMALAGGFAAVVGCAPLGPRPGATETTPDRLAGVFDLENRPIDPFRVANAGVKAIVFIFVRTDCPISNRYAPEIERLHDKYTPLGVAFWLVYPEMDATPQDIARHVKEYRLSLAVLRDTAQSLVKKTGVRVTPEAAVFSADGRELYRGRIDNRMVDFGKERPAPTRRDLDNALASILNHKPVIDAIRPAVGCYLPEQR